MLAAKIEAKTMKRARIRDAVDGAIFTAILSVACAQAHKHNYKHAFMWHVCAFATIYIYT